MNPSDDNEGRRRSYLHAIRQQRIEREQRDWYIRRLVLSSFEQGATWKEIGEALGISTQAAWKKYRPEAPQKILPGQGPYHIEHNE